LSGDEFFDALVEAVAKKRGIPPEEARVVLALFRDKTPDAFSNLREMVKVLGEGLAVISGLPPDAARTIAPILTTAVPAALGGGEGGLDALVTKATVAKQLLGDGGGDRYTQLLEKMLEKRDKELEELKARIEEVGQKMEEKEREELLARIQELQGQIERLAAEASQPRPAEGEEKPRDLASRILETLGEVEKFVNALEKLGYKVERGGSPSLEDMAKMLEQYGFEVKRRTITERELEEIAKRIREEERRRLEVELGVEEKRIETIGNIIRDAIHEIASRFAQAWADVQREALREQLRARLQASGVRIVGGAGGVEGGGGKGGEAGEGGAGEGGGQPGG